MTCPYSGIRRFAFLNTFNKVNNNTLKNKNAFGSIFCDAAETVKIILQSIC